jgi:hypothetical protein
MKKLFIVLAILALVVGAASASKRVATPMTQPEQKSRANVVGWFDDMEGDLSGYFTADLTAGAVSHWQVSDYMAYEGTYSWWCGNFDYDANGGYGNSWDDRLDIPEIDMTGMVMPVLTYAFRNDTELTYDFSYVQAESAGSYVSLNRGYDGRMGWSDIGVFGFLMGAYDNPLHARFRFVSDGAWSDEDGNDTIGGAFAVDIVRVFDYATATDVFFDDVESGGLCVPSVPAAAGDWWHPITRLCPAYSDPTSWWCGDDADTSLVPPMLSNALFTPVADITGAWACTLTGAFHFAIPTIDNDYVAFYSGIDGGGYYGIASYWGDFGTCNGWAFGIALDYGQVGVPPFTTVESVFVMNTTENGCGPAGGGDAGFMIDDLTFWINYDEPVPVHETSWSNIKRMYR